MKLLKPLLLIFTASIVTKHSCIDAAGRKRGHNGRFIAGKLDPAPRDANGRFKKRDRECKQTNLIPDIPLPLQQSLLATFMLPELVMSNHTNKN